jgi:hypothetical protein
VPLPWLVEVDPLPFEVELADEFPLSEVVAVLEFELELTGEHPEVVPPQPVRTMAKATKRIDEWLLSFMIKPPEVTLSMAQSFCKTSKKVSMKPKLHRFPKSI